VASQANPLTDQGEVEEGAADEQIQSTSSLVMEHTLDALCDIYP